MKKVDFKFNNQTFKVDARSFRTIDFNGSPLPTPYFWFDRRDVAKIIRQYIKSKFPNIVSFVRSESFSGGDAVNVYLSDERGNEVPSEIYDDVRRFSKTFQEGRFNGMIDLYEYNESSLKSKDGYTVKGGAKYVSVNNYPPFGTTPDIVLMIQDAMNGVYVGGKRSFDEAVEYVRSYDVSEKSLEKALSLLNE